MQIVPYGFTELWLVSKDAWVVPVHCEPYSSNATSVTHWHVKPAQQLLAGPFEELRKRFGPKNLSDKSKSDWYVSDADLKSIATKAEGCDHTQYLKWDDVERPTKDTVGIEEVTGPTKVEEKFLHFLCKRAAIDYKLGRYFWAALKDSMLEWLINTQRPIDFEVFEVQPMPYRANWKEIMLAKHPAVAPIFRGPQEKWRDELTACGFMQNLGSTDLVAMNGKSKTFYWTLEIEIKPLWVKAVEDAERSRMFSKKPSNYLRYYESCIRRRLKDTLKIYAAWIDEIRRPVGQLSESSISGAPVLLPVAKRGTVLPSWHRPDQVVLQPNDGPRLIQGQGARRRVEKKAQEMLLVPALDKHRQDMRKLEEPDLLEESGDGSNGTSGVRLLHSGEGETEVIDVLAERHGPDGSGVDE